MDENYFLLKNQNVIHQLFCDKFLLSLDGI